MTFKVYNKGIKKSIKVELSNKCTLSNLAFAIAVDFDLDIDGHTYMFCKNLRRMYVGKQYIEDDELQIKCSKVFSSVGEKLLFVQDLGELNQFIVTFSNKKP